MNYKKILVTVLTVATGILFSAGNVLAHVVVKPGEVGVGARTNFVVSVPTEEEVPTVSVRLIVPEGVKSVRPNAKSGWNIELKKEGEGDSERVTEIIWSGGRIPAELRDEFIFSAQAPAQEGSINWKAYQTYADGDIVAWDTDPQAVAEYAKNNPPKPGVEHDHTAPKPFSVTKVINDLAPQTPTETKKAIDTTSVLATFAIFLSGLSLVLQFRKK